MIKGKVLSAVSLFLFLTPTALAARPIDTNYLYIILFFISIFILILGKLLKNNIFTIFSGFLFALLGIYTFINGIPGHTTSWLQGGYKDGWISFTSIILLGMGLYLLLKATYKEVWK